MSLMEEDKPKDMLTGPVSVSFLVGSLIRSHPSFGFLSFTNYKFLNFDSTYISKSKSLLSQPMSASAVSITANTAARRRPVVVGEKKSNLELLLNEAQVNGRGADDSIAADGGNSKDLSHHSIRGEPVSLVKKSLPNSTVSPRRTRKVAITKPEKPLWLRIVSVFTKNFVLFLILFGLVQMVRKLALKSRDPVLETQMGLSEVEGRIAEVERTMMTASRMLQGQLEILDKKIDNEVEELRKEVTTKIEDSSKYFEIEMKKLAASNEVMEGLLRELNLADWLSKEEFEKFIEELRKGNIGDENGFSHLDDLRAYASDLVVKEIEKHAAEGLGRVDYALASGGAVVVKHSEAYLAGSRGNWLALINRNAVHKDAEKMLKPSFGEPGNCFSLKGSSGFVQIRLRSAIVPEAVTLEHVAKNVAYDRSSAPKDCRVSGWLQGSGLSTADGTDKMLLLTEFTYDLEKSNAQTFNVLDSAASSVVDTVRLDFTSNHGQDTFTCIYRLRLHGHEPESVSMIPALA